MLSTFLTVLIVGGAVTQTNNSVLALDEFDKCSKEMKIHISSIVDNGGTINIAKAGTIANIRTNVRKVWNNGYWILIKL